MIRLFTIAFIFLSFCSAYGQIPSDLKIGSYKNLNDLLNNNPQLEYKFTITQRTEFAIKMAAGNDFKVTSDSGKVSGDVINSKTFAVFDGKNLYLNGNHINGYKHYCLVENNQRLLILKAGIPSFSKSKKVGYDKSMINTEFSPLGGALGGAISGAELAMIRLYYIVDCKKNTIKILSRIYLLKLLSDYPDLRREFDTEYDLDNSEVLLNYIRKINEK